MTLALATPESCPYCSGNDPQTVEAYSANYEGQTIALCLMCASPIKIVAGTNTTTKATEAEARDALSADDYQKFLTYQRRIRCDTPERRAYVLAQIRQWHEDDTQPKTD